MIFVQHHSDLPVPHAEHNTDMQPDQSSQALLWISDTTRRIDDSFLCDIHCMIHQIKKDLVLTLKVMIEPALAQLQSGGNIVHGGAVVSLLLEKTGSGAENLLPGINRGLAGHRRTY